VKPIDIFKIEPDGKPLWLGAFANFAEAREKALKERASDRDCQFQILGQRTGQVRTLSRRELDSPSD
jgi:hypothetical protein